MSRVVVVALGARAYRIVFAETDTWTPASCPELGEGGRRALFVTDENVGRHWEQPVGAALEHLGFRLHRARIPAGEASKSLPILERLYDALLAGEVRRDGWVIALGGGVVGDLAGLAAATYMRGIAWVQIPTSLLAMADSSVGGKVGIDHGNAKNVVGAFHQPRLVLTAPGFLRTLPDAELANGAAEVVKAGLIGDPDLLDLLERKADAIWSRDSAVLLETISRAVQVKARIVEEDEREAGRRQLLNLGHTFGHALESAQGFQGIRHGEAVAVGLVAACRLSYLLGLAPEALGERVEQLLLRYRLPIRWPGLAWAQVRPWFAQDKKAREDGWTFVLTGGVGDASVHRHVPEAPVREATAYVLA